MKKYINFLEINIKKKKKLLVLKYLFHNIMFFVKKQGWCPNYIVKSLYFSINIIDTKITKLTWRGGVPIILSNHFSILILKYRNLYGRWWYCIFCENILVTIGVTYFSIAHPPDSTQIICNYILLLQKALI